MTKNRFFAFGVLLVLVCGAAVLAGQTRMRSGEVTIFQRSGDSVIDQIKGYSKVRLLLVTENSGDFQIGNVWMINFVDDAWNFPDERNQMNTDDHYVFLRNGGMAHGQIGDFSRERRSFLFESGEEFPLNQIRRIYFSRNVPASLSGEQGGQGGGGGNVWVGTFSRSSPSPPMDLELREDGTAQMTIEAVGGRTLILNGRWQDIDGRTIRVNVVSDTVRTDRRTMVFGLERNTLISLSGSMGANVRLRRR
jgi:hypothetical protein